MIILGPAYNANHGGHVNGWYLILVGGAVLLMTWRKYFKGELRRGTHIGILVGISAVCALFIITGVWELLHQP
jgi:hypothetical protein